MQMSVALEPNLWLESSLPYRFQYNCNKIMCCWADSESPKKKKRRSQSSNKRQRSLSPLSKRMAMLGDGDSASRTHNSQFNHPYGYQPPPPPTTDEVAPTIRSQADIDYELKVTCSELLSIIMPWS